MSSRDTASPSGPGGPSGRLGVVLRVAALLLVLLAANWLIADLLLPDPESRAEIPYRPTFLEEIRAGNVERISPEGEKVVGRFAQPVEVPDVASGDEGQGSDAEGGRTTERFATTIPAFADEEELSTLLERGDVVITAEPEEEGGVGPLTMLLWSFGPVILLVLLFLFLMRRAAGAMGGGGPFGQLGRSKARRIEGQEQDVRFADVAGIDEAKGELEEVVDFLREPDRYRSLGARIPRGVLLTGPPGTGKTLLARAVAGEAGAPFFSLSGSEFVEMVVGVGASRVRDLFGEAKKESSAIVFIDELDAVGRRRSGSTGVSGGNDEREQTLNQILTEMDGFEQSDAVIVLAATNRPEDLDEALTRPGRFDRQVDIAAPDRDGRVSILGVHTKSLPLAEDVDLDRLAAMTPGMTGADLANLANEAALAAARRHSREVAFVDFEEAFDRLALGRPRGITLSEEDRRLTAYHEAGHALVGMLTPRADPVRKITIMPRGQGLGVTLAAPDADRVNYRRADLLARLRVLLGGRVAEELACDDITTGAENDLEQVTDVARRMAGRWGMSERLGPLSLLPRDGSSPLEGQQGGGGEDARRRVDEEAERVVCDLHTEVKALLADHREQLDTLAAALLEHETLEEDAIYSAVGLEDQLARGEPAPAPASG